jgi:hypothetical protein
MEIIWLILGTISIVILYNSILKKTGMDKIPIDQIKGWIRVLGRKIFYRIKEWKNRDLLEVKSESEYINCTMFTKNGILE